MRVRTRLVASFVPSPTPERANSWFEPRAVAGNLRYATRIARGELSGPTILVYEVPTRR